MSTYKAYFEVCDETVLIRHFNPSVSAQHITLSNKEKAVELWNLLKEQTEAMGYVEDYKGAKCFCLYYKPTRHYIQRLKSIVKTCEVKLSLKVKSKAVGE